MGLYILRPHAAGILCAQNQIFLIQRESAGMATLTLCGMTEAILAQTCFTGLVCQASGVGRRGVVRGPPKNRVVVKRVPGGVAGPGF